MPKDKKQDLYNLALKGGKDSELLLLDKIHSLEDQLDNHISGMKEAMSEMRSEMKEMMIEMKGEMPDLNKVLESVKGKDGENGMDSEVPGPKGEKGDKGNPGKDGKDGMDGVNGLNGSDGKDGLNGKDGMDGKDGSPDTPEQIADKLESLEGEERLDKSAIKGLDELEKYVRTIPTGRVVSGRGGMNAWTHEKFSVGAATTTITLQDAPGAGGLGVMVYYNGVYCAIGSSYSYTVNGKVITLNFTPEADTTIDVIYQTIFRTI